MATKNVVRVINEDPDSYFGLTFPLKEGVDNNFIRSSTLREQASSNIKNLLLTIKGERVGQPNFGSRLSEILFEPINEEIGDRIQSAIEEALEEWLPYVVAENVTTFVDEKNPNLITVSLEFRVTIDDPDAIETITFNFNTGA
jgi:phage baseplate assembly protein W